MSHLIRCADVTASFNQQSADLKAEAIQRGMHVTAEWTVGVLQCFHAESSQAQLKAGLARYAEAGACVNIHPRIWYTIPSSGRITEYVMVPPKTDNQRHGNA